MMTHQHAAVWMQLRTPPWLGSSDGGGVATASPRVHARPERARVHRGLQTWRYHGKYHAVVTQGMVFIIDIIHDIMAMNMISCMISWIFMIS